MKIFSIKIMLLMAALVIAGLASSSLWFNAAGLIGTIVIIVLIHLDNLDFCRKLDRIRAGEKNVKL